MNLLSLILKSLLTDDTLAALVKKTGLSKAILKKLIPLAIPLLIKFMTNNASSQAGALSLLNALGQHTSKKSLADQITEADTTDGSKILGHILGNQSGAVFNSLAQQSGVSSQDVSNVLSEVAPAVLSSLSAANSATSAKKVDLSDGLDLSELMTLFSGAAQAQPQASGNNMLSSLLGGSNSLGGGLFGSLLGATAQQADNDSSVNGTQLLSLLSALK